MLTFLLCMKDLSTNNYRSIILYTGFDMFETLFNNKILISQVNRH